MQQSTMDKHKHLLADGTWNGAYQYTQNCAYDERQTYALIRKTGGTKCGPAPGRDCDKVVRRVDGIMFDMVAGGGAPGQHPSFSQQEGFCKPEDYAEPQPYDGTQPGPTPQPPQPVPVVPGREEAMDELNWLHKYYQAKEGLQRPQGLWRDDLGTPDFEGISAWYLDVYQQARIHGKSRADARADYVNQIRHSAEWQQKHPGETP